jgi:hypothetical protein
MPTAHRRLPAGSRTIEGPWPPPLRGDHLGLQRAQPNSTAANLLIQRLPPEQYWQRRHGRRHSERDG